MSEVQTTLRLNDQASSVLQRVANAARQTASQMQQTGRSIDQAFRSNGPNAFASQAGSAINSVSSSAESLGNTIDSIFDDVDTSGFASDLERGFSSATSGADEFASSAEDAGEAVEELSSSAEDLGENIEELGSGGTGLDDVGRDAAEAGNEMDNASGKALNLGNALKAMVAAIGVAKIAGEVKQFVSDSIALGTSYTAMMSEVAAISGATGAEYEMLEATAREYGATTIFSASEAAEALKYMSLAGWDANQSASALGGVLNLAAASGMGLGQASDMVTDYLSAFGMEASQAGYFADMLAYAQENSNTSAAQLGEAYLNSAANLHAAGQDIETTTSLLEAMANQGTKGSRAGTQLAAITRDITNSMEDGSIQIGKTSVAVQDQYGNFRDLTDIMTDVEKAVDGMGSAERAAALAETFTADSTKGVNQILTEGMENIARYEEELRNSSGAAQQASDTMTDNLQGDMANMNSAFEEMQLQVFEGLEGNLRTGAQYVTNTIIPALTEWVPSAIGTIGDAIAKVGNAVAPLFTTLLKNPKAVGTALASLGGFFATMKAASIGSSIMSTVSGMGGLAGVVNKLGGAIMAHPWALGAAAVVAGVVAIKGAVDQYNEAQREASLETHFGSIELSDADAAEMAGKIIGVDWVANINLALGEFENAEQFHEQAEEALQSNAELLWKAAVQTELNHAGEDPVSPFVEGIQTVLTGRQDSSGLEYTANVPTELDPEGDTATMANTLVEFANLAVSGANATELEEYAKTVATQIDPDGDQAGMTAALVGFAQGVVDGASAEELNDYINTITVDLTPEESDTFFGALTAVVNGMSTTELTVPDWKDTLNIELTPEMAEDFKTNIQTYLDSKQQELASLTFAAKTSMETVLGDKAGQALISQMQTWAAEDTAELNGLSSSLTQLVQGALEDGVLDVEEQAAIDILQSKINNILAGWQQAQADAEWQTLQQKWSGRQLSSDSFVQLMEEAHSQRQTAMDALYADSTQMNAVFNGWLNSGKINQTQREQLNNLWTNNMMNMEGEAMGRALAFGSNTLMDTYGDLVNENLGRISEMGGGDTLNALNQMAESGAWDVDRLWSEFASSRDFYSKNGGADRKALNSMYESMKPDVSDMGSLIDTYREQGMAIPTALMDAYNQAIDIGAASGDADAGWQKYANSLMESGNEQLIDALTNQNNPMYETMRNQMPQELQEAVDRASYAAQNQVESADLSELFNSVLGLDDPNAEIDMARLSELCEKYGLDISDYLAEKGIEVDGSNTKMKIEDFDPAEAAQYSGLTATGNQITLEGGEVALEYEVNTSDTLSGIAEKTGVALEDLKAANQQIFDERGTWDLIYEGDMIYIPQADTAGTTEATGEAIEENTNAAEQTAEAANTDVETAGTVNGDYSAGTASGAEEAGQELANQASEQAAAAEPPRTEQEIPASITINLQSLDSSALSEGINGALAESQEAISIDVPADVTVSVGTVDSSALSTSIGTALGGEDGTGSVPVSVPADVTVTVASENSAAIYTEVGGKLDTAFGTSYTPAGSTDVTLTETDNVPAIYSQVGEKVRSAFSAGYTAHASVSVTLTANYSLANPTKTISFGGGATGSATVTASLHALGGYFDQEHLGIVAEDGPEYIIPMDGSDRSREMWAEAGDMLGVMDQPIETMPQGSGNVARGSTEASQQSKDINLNINGSGSMRVTSNMSKEDILNVMIENVKDVLMDIIQNDILVEGDGAYEY